MRTVFVNPTVYSRGVRPHYMIGHRAAKKKKKGGGKKKKKTGTALAKANPYILNPRRRNPSFHDIGGIARETFTLAAGAAGGAILNRVGINNVANFYVRNGLRVLAAAFLSTVTSQPAMAIAAAGAVLAPVVPEVETQLAASSLTKNPSELAAELADLLDADLSDDLDDGDVVSEDGEVSW